jgi:hypothetical protein
LQAALKETLDKPGPPKPEPAKDERS